MAMDRRELDLREKGFTLAEVLIALTIFATGILSVAQMLMIGEKWVAGGHKSFTAVQTALFHRIFSNNRMYLLHKKRCTGRGADDIRGYLCLA